MRKLSLLLALCLLIGLLPAAASAVTVVDSGTCGENLTWTLDSEGVLTISGTGDMVKETGQSAWGWANYISSKIRTVVVDSGVTSIGERAFHWGLSLTSVSLPDSVKSIHAYAFDSCIYLTEIRLPESLEYLAETAFFDCSRIEKYTVPEGNRYFKNDAAGALYSMDGTVLYAVPATLSGEYVIAEGVRTLYTNTFLFQNGMTGVYIPASVETIEPNAFYQCGHITGFRVSGDNPYFEHDENGLLYTKGRLGLVCLPGGKTGTVTLADTTVWIEPYAADGCNAQEIVLPETLEIIEEHAFDWCTWLERINLPDSLSFIGEYAFYRCEKLKQISIPGSVKLVSEDAFNGCCALESVEIQGGVEIIGSYAFAHCEKLESITVPESVHTIESGALSGCEALKEIQLPESLKQIDSYAFNNCPLETITYNGIASQWEQVDVKTYGNDPLLNSKIQYLRVEGGFTAVRDGWNVINVHPSFGYSKDFRIDFSQYYATGPSFGTVAKSILTRFYDEWNGNCFGLSVLAVAHYNGQIDLRAYFDKEGDSLNEFGYETIMANTYGGEPLQGNIYSLRGNEEIISVIERVQCSQYSSEIAAAEVFKLDTDYSEVLAYLNQENPAPLVVAVEGNGGHALVTDTTYKPVDMENGQYMIICYDCNAPKLTNPLAKGAARYDYPHSCVVLDTTNGKGYYFLNNDPWIEADNVFYNRGVRFYDVRKLDSDFFEGVDLTLLGENSLFVETEKYFSITNPAGDVLFEVVDGVPTVYSPDVQYIQGAWDTLEGERPAVGYLALPAGTYTYTSSGDAAVVHVGADFTAAYEVDGDAAVTVDDSLKKITVTNPTDTSGLTLKAAIADADVTVEASVEGALEREGSVSVCVNAHSKTAEVGSSIPPEDLKITAQVDGEVREDRLQLVHLHSWNEWVQTKDPNYLEDGEKTRSCVECGETETEVVDNNIFSDVKQDRFENAILWAYYEGITTGTGDGTTFSPENACTRKQIVTFLWRAAGEPEPKSMENPFTDVKADRFEKAILWAYYEGITTGTGDGSTFSPENTCTRKQIVTFLWRFYDEPAPKNMENKFVDVKNDRFTAAILWAAEQGITTGTGDGSTFSPEAPCTRKQIVTFLYRAHQIGQPQALETDMALPEQMRLLVK